MANSVILVTGIKATARINNVNVWGLISDIQTPAWATISNPQTPAWSEPSNNQSAAWYNIADSQPVP